MSFSILGLESQIVCVPGTAYGTYPISFMCWYKPATANETARKFLFCVQNAANTEIHALIVDTDDVYKLIFMSSDPTAEAVLSSGVSTINGTWQCVIVTLVAVAGTKNIYVDSASVSATVSTNAVSITPVQYSIGGRYVAGGADLAEHPNGDIAEVALWNVELSAANIANLYTDKYSPDRVASPKFYMPLQSSLMRQLGAEATRANQIAEAAGGPIIDFTEHTAIGIDYGSGPIYSGV